MCSAQELLILLKGFHKKNLPRIGLLGFSEYSMQTTDGPVYSIPIELHEICPIHASHKIFSALNGYFYGFLR